jgi:alpha-tubulin suppressor-like RCC1 family protein
MIRVFETRAGFALPTILIASMVMLIVLITSVSATSSVRTSLDGQYYTQLAREAAESGLARANGCLQLSGYIPGWTGSTLYPNTSCSGGNPCTNAASCFVTQRPTLRTTFSVATPQDLTVSQLIRSVGKVELLRSSNGEVWRTYTFSASARVSADLSFNTVAFGYVNNAGSFFATIAVDGKMQATGLNQNGQLGNGTTNATLTPTPFKLNDGDKATAIFTNFLSSGVTMFALTDKGTIYGAGLNDKGQLGDGSFTSPRSTPVKFGLPADDAVGKFVSTVGHATYVLTTKNNIYSVGSCEYGHLGYDYTVSGCANKSTVSRVLLPPPDESNLNTIPTNNIVNDFHSVFVRMQGGRVYGWGDNGSGQFGNGTKTGSSAPTQLGQFGDAGQPKAISIATDGISLWVVDDAGKVWSAGSNGYGQLGGGNIEIRVDSIGRCLDNVSGNGVNMQFYQCNQSWPQQWTWRSDKTIYSQVTGKCLNVEANNETVTLAACSNSNMQKFEYHDPRYINNVGSGRCLHNKNNDGVTLAAAPCVNTANMLFTLPDVPRFNAVALPASAGSAVKVSTDQWFTAVLTSTGDVYSFGLNNRGQLGSGTAGTHQPSPVKFILPVGVTAKDVYVTAGNAIGTTPRNNTFVVGSDGKVYGAGSNEFGQLGNGTTVNSSTPVAMNVINGVNVRAKEVITGWGTTVVITEDRKVYTVGNNENGQLGDGTTNNSSTPKANRYTNVLPVTSF